MACGLTSRYCATCQQEGVHRGLTCIHCGAICTTHDPICLVKNQKIKPTKETMFGKAKALRDSKAGKRKTGGGFVEVNSMDAAMWKSKKAARAC